MAKHAYRERIERLIGLPETTYLRAPGPGGMDGGNWRAPDPAGLSILSWALELRGSHVTRGRLNLILACLQRPHCRFF